MTEVYLGIGILCVIFICFALAIISGKRHAQATKQFLKTIGFSHTSYVEDNKALLQGLRSLSLFSRNKT